MDGTIADLYGVENWLNDLRSEVSRPYKIAKANVNLSLLARYLNKLKNSGYKIGVISWTSMQASKEYEKEIAAAKFIGLSIISLLCGSMKLILYHMVQKKTFLTVVMICFLMMMFE